MKKITYIIIIILIGFRPAFGQHLTKTYIDEFIIKTFAPAELDSTVLYVLNGVPFNHRDIELELAKFNVPQLYGIAFLNEIFTSAHFDGNKKGIILLVAGKQKRKQINELLKTARAKYNPNDADHTETIPKIGEPVLIINGELVKQTDCYNSVNELKSKNIETINVINEPVSQEYYGPNGKYGLIMIWLK